MSTINKSMSDIIKARIRADHGSFLANENISKYINTDDELQQLQNEVQKKVEDLLQSLVIDTHNDHNTKDTARRVAKMYIREVFNGRYAKEPDCTSFPNYKQFGDLYIIGPIQVRSACSHHLVPILGKVWVGAVAPDKLKGLSKFNRLTNWVMARPQIQEEAVVILADALEKEMKPEGLAIVMNAAHMCVSWRGVKDNDTKMMTSIMRGSFLKSDALRMEFLTLIQGMGFNKNEVL